MQLNILIWTTGKHIIRKYVFNEFRQLVKNALVSYFTWLAGIWHNNHCTVAHAPPDTHKHIINYSHTATVWGKKKSAACCHLKYL